MTTLRDDVARATDPDIWSAEADEDASYPLAKRRLAEAREESRKRADAAIAVVLERAAQVADDLAQEAEGSNHCRGESMHRKTAETIRNLKEPT